jgi:hypothetical protein
MAYTIWLGVNGQRELKHATYGNINRDNVITPTLNTPTFITPTLGQRELTSPFLANPLGMVLYNKF